MPLKAADLQAHVGADIADLEKGLKQAGAEVKGFSATGSKDLAGLGQAMQSLNPQVAMLGQAVRYGVAGGMLYAGVQAATATIEFARMGAETERLSDSFAGLYSDAGTLGKLRAATRGAISDVDLMMAANTASLLKVGRNVDEIARLWEVAIDRGAKLGKTALESVNAVNVGIGRNSPQILDNVGIVGLAESAYRDYAAILDKTVDQLTDAEQKQALVNGVMQLGGAAGGPIDNAALGFERIDAAIANIKARGGLAASDLFGPGVVELSELLTMLGTSQEELARSTHSVEEFHTRLQEMYDFQRRSKIAPFLAIIPGVNVQLGMKDLTDAQIRAIQLQQDWNNRAREMGNMLPYMTAGLQNMGEGWLSVSAGAEQAKNATLSWIMNLPGQIMQAVGAMQALNDQVTSIEGQISGRVAGMVTRGSVSPEQAKRWLVEYAEGVLRIQNMTGISDQERQWRLDLYKAQWNETFAGIETGFRQLSVSASDAFDSMRSDLQGIFQPTQMSSFTNQLDQMGRHVDTWDEQARRMADVANRGMESPWAKMLNIPPEVAAQGNDAVKAYAIQWQQSFYAGMMPQEINMQAVIDRYRDQLTSRANWENIFRAAEQAIKDQGMDFNQALFDQTVSGMTGGATGPGAGAGSAITAGMPAAFAANPISKMIKDAFDADMAKQGADTLRLIGVASVKTIVGAMEDGFKNANFLKMMATAVAPGVWEWIQQQQSRKSGGG